MKQGLDPEEVEEVISRKLNELDPLITSFEFVLNVENSKLATNSVIEIIITTNNFDFNVFVFMLNPVFVFLFLLSI